MLYAMRFAPDSEAAAWLEQLDGEHEDFDWDEGNRNKNQIKHEVSTEAIESILNNAIVFVGRIVEPEHTEPRWILLGEDSDERRLTLAFTRRGNRLRPISCRPMKRKERKFYEQALKED